MSGRRRRVTHLRRWRGCPKFFRAESRKSRSLEKTNPPSLIYRHPSPPSPFVDETIRSLVFTASTFAEARPAAVAYLEAYGIPEPAAVAERHDLYWTDERVLARMSRRLAKRTGGAACAARGYLRVWAAALRRPGLLIPIVDGGAYVSAKLYRPPEVGADGKERRGKYFLKGLGGRYLWGADEVEEAIDEGGDVTILVVEGEGDKMAIDGLCRDGVVAVTGGGTGLAADAARLARIAAWRDPLLEAAGGRRPRVVVVADPGAPGRAAAVAIAEATGAEVVFPAADARDLVKKSVRAF